MVAIDQHTGKQRWRRSFWATGRTYTHPTSSNAAPTPVSDGQYIYAFYSSNDLACLDLSGNLMWYRGLAHDYPKAGNDVGMASSPAIAGDVVVVQIENQGDSFASGIDRLSARNSGGSLEIPEQIGAPRSIQGVRWWLYGAVAIAVGLERC